MDEKEFFDIWKDVCKKNDDEISNAWTCNYTHTILGRNNQNSIVNQVLTKLNENKSEEWDIHQEYYKSDVVFYKNENCQLEHPFKDVSNYQRSNTPSNFGGVWLKHIDIHLEHENNIKTSWQEVIQLQNIPGDINVLVTYPITDDDKERTEVLKAYQKLLSEKCKDFKLLVIFGVKNEKNDEEKVSWFGHILEDDGEIENL